MSAEFDEWMVEARRNDALRRAALEANPEGGIYYKPHPLMVHSGQFWRCKHGGPPLNGCLSCAITHPIWFLRWHGWLK